VPAAYGELPDGWRWSRLDEASEGVFDCPHSTPELTATGPFVVRTQDIITGVFRADHAARVSEETYAERTARVIPGRGDLLYSREGTYFGIAAEVPRNTRVCLGQRMVLIRPDKRQLDFGFLCRWLNSPIMAAHIHGYRDGTVAERLNLPTIRALPVLIPPLPEQRAIAHILGTLDDKIELNRRMNQTLEAMAQALFKSWFVDPTRDGLPKGWREVPFAETVSILGGGTPKTSVSEYWGGGIPWFSVADAPQNSDVFVIDTEKKITQVGVDNSSTQILPVGTSIISARGTVGKVALVGVPMAMNQSCYGLRGKAGARGFYTYYSTRALVSELQQHAHGSVFDTITRDTLAGVSIAEPPSPSVEQFEEAIAPCMERIKSNLLQSRTLAQLRDTLLPKLLSGELRVAA